MKAAKKILKILAWTIGVLFVLVIALVLTIPWWISPTVTRVANTFGPSIVKTNLHLGDFGLDPYKGIFHTGDFQLSNPVGFDEPHAVELGEFRVELEPKTVLDDVIHIKLVRVNGVFVSYCFNRSFTSNFTALQEGMNGGRTEEPKKEETAPKAKSEETSGTTNQKKVIIDRLEIDGVVAKIGKVQIALTPKPVVFTDIGKDSGGRTLTEVYDQTIGPLVNATDSAVTALQTSVKLTAGAFGQRLDAGKQSVEDLGKELKSAGKELKKAGKALKGVGTELQDLFKK